MLEMTTHENPLALAEFQQDEILNDSETVESDILSFETLFPHQTPEEVFPDRPEFHVLLRSSDTESVLVRQVLTLSVYKEVVESFAKTAGRPHLDENRMNGIEDALLIIEAGQSESLEWFSEQTNISHQDLMTAIATGLEDHLHRIQRFS